MLERGDDVGGTWHYNTYPGCACDVPSHLYSFSFAPNPEWSDTYSRQPEIRDYLQRVADRVRRPPARAPEHATSSGRVGRGRARWTVETSDGPLRARVLVAGMGPLAEPQDPGRSPGSRDFEGATFHSARWDHDYDLTGKRVAVDRHRRVGDPVRARDPAATSRSCTSSSAPPPWIMPHTDRPITRASSARLYRALPGAAEARARRRLRAPRAAACSASSSTRG